MCTLCVQSVCLRVPYLVCSMIPLVFLQVLEPFCPLSEQENSEPEELEVSQPTSSPTVFLTSQKELNHSPLPSDSPSTPHKDQSCGSSLGDTESTSVPLTVPASTSFPDGDSVLQPPPLSDCTSTSEQCLVAVLPLSSSPSKPLTEIFPAQDESCIPLQTQSDPPIIHPCEDVTATPICELLADESTTTQKENTPLEMVASHSSLQNSVNDSLV